MTDIESDLAVELAAATERRELLRSSSIGRDVGVALLYGAREPNGNHERAQQRLTQLTSVVSEFSGTGL